LCAVDGLLYNKLQDKRYVAQLCSTARAPGGRRAGSQSSMTKQANIPNIRGAGTEGVSVPMLCCVCAHRYALVKEKRALTKFLKCVDWTDAQEAQQVGPAYSARVVIPQGIRCHYAVGLVCQSWGLSLVPVQPCTWLSGALWLASNISPLRPHC
jgi:hypothetical protein